MQRKVFKNGETVFAKWPGSTLYYKGVVQEYNPVEKEYQLKFENNDLTEIPAKDVYAEQVFASGRSRSKSPSRRRRSRSSSRSRRQRSKSPARTASPSPKAKRQPRSPARKVMEQSRSITTSVKRVASEKSTVKGNVKEQLFSEKTLITQSTPDVEEIKSRSELQRSVAQITAHSDTREEHATITRRTTRSVTRALQESHFEEQEEKKEEATSYTFLGKVQCFLVSIASLLMHVMIMFFPLIFTLYVYLTCKTKKKCTFTKLPKLPNIRKFYSWEAIAFMFGWFTFQAVLSLLPLGKEVSGPILSGGRRLRYRINGAASLVINLAAFALFRYYGIGLVVLKNPSLYPSFVTGSFLFSLLLSFVVFILSRCGRCTTEAIHPSEGLVKDFVFGRLLHPRLSKPFTFDFKTFGFKICFITWGMLNFCYLMKQVDKSGYDIMKQNPSLVLLVAAQSWYILDAFVFEEKFLYAASLQKEKAGFLTFAGFFLFPFFCATQARYLLLYPLALPWYCYAIPVIMQVVGYVIYRQSNNQKFNFRANQHQAKLAGVDYITTNDGKNLLIDGWWKKLRHPNYLGDLMMNIAWALFCGFHHVHPWIYPIFLLLCLIGMAAKDNANCKKRYGSGWKEYEDRVKYSVIPYVY